MAVFARVLEATRSNLQRDEAAAGVCVPGRLEYTERQASRRRRRGVPVDGWREEPGSMGRGSGGRTWGPLNSALLLTKGALDADQSALSIVANNVANANTPGYTEEIPTWRENAPIQIDGVSSGDGASETGATSLRDRVLEERLNQQQQLASASGTRLTALNSLQALFTPDSGSSTSKAGDIGSDITSFFSSFSSLEANPTNNALRQQVLSSATTLAGDVSNAAASLNQQRSALDQEASLAFPAR
jgi:flagellar hook-associated protein 1 FlgK